MIAICLRIDTLFAVQFCNSLFGWHSVLKPILDINLSLNEISLVGGSANSDAFSLVKTGYPTGLTLTGNN